MTDRNKTYFLPDANNCTFSADSPLALRVYESVSGNTTTTYIGYANPGTGEGEAKWMVKKVVVVVGDTTTTTVTWADGNGLNDNIVSNYASLTYI